MFSSAIGSSSIRRHGKVYYQEYSRGIPTTKFRQTGATQSGERHGPKITFHASFAGTRTH